MDVWQRIGATRQPRPAWRLPAAAQSSRRPVRRCAVALLVALLTSTALAASEIYRTEDEDGNVTFTDQPPSDDAEPMPLGEINILQPTAERSAEQEGADETGAEDEQPAPDYNGVRIVFPPAGQATRRVTGEVPVRVELEPASAELAAGYEVRIDVDGNEAGRAQSTEVRVGTLDPGPHDLRAAVVAPDGSTVVESETLRFYLIRQTTHN